MIDYDNTIVICLGLGNLTRNEMVNLCIKHDKEKDWTYGLSREYLEKHAEDWYNCNEMLIIKILNQITYTVGCVSLYINCIENE